VNSRFQEMKIFYAYDWRQLPTERWVGIVLRNLPPDCTADMLKKNF